MSNKKPEALLATRISNYMQINYPDVIFRFDLAADLKMTIGQATRNKRLHGKFNKSYPDLFIARANKKYGGLYIELKAMTKTGNVPNTAHTREQGVIHQILRESGYKADFAVGFDQSKLMIDEYLKIKRKKK